MQDDYREPLGYPVTLTGNAQTTPVIDTLGMKSMTVQLAGTFALTVTPEQSNDGSNWRPLPVLNNETVSGTPVTTFNVVGMWVAALHARYVRFRTTSYTSGSAFLTPILRTLDLVSLATTVQGTASVAILSNVISTAASGLSRLRVRAAAAANQDATLVKSSAGNLADIVLINRAAAERFIKFYDKATAPTSADAPAFTIALKAGEPFSINLSAPIRFAAGIGYRITTAVADADATAATAEDVHGFLLFN